MRAAVYYEYGPPDVVEVKNVAKPVPRDHEVLIRVRAASVNPLDFRFMRGTPNFIRLGLGLRKPKSPRLGVDVAGQVEEVGRKVTRFKPGDEVFGSCRGAFAEYVTTSESILAMKPTSVTFEKAAAVPVAGYSALQALRDYAKIQPGQTVLVNGASGGVGTFAVQIANWYGAEVTGVCSTRNLEMVRSLGAHHVIDYTEEDFTKGSRRYDVLCDCVGNHTLAECRQVLSAKGVHLPIGGKGDAFFGPLLKKLVLAPFLSQKMVPFFMAKNRQEDLAVLADLMKSGTLTAVIDRTYSLSEVPESLKYLEQGHARGKIVISVEDCMEA